MITPLERVLDALQTDGSSPRQNASGWSARCPAHEDHIASLSITEGDDGRVLLFCHAMCPSEDVVKALGLTMRDLFVNADKPAAKRSVFDYRDAEGALLYRAIRREVPGGKRFHVERPDGTMGLGSVPPVLYRLPELLAGMAAGRCVLIPEGEKCVDVLVALGFIATCNPFGAGKWQPHFTEVLRNATTVVVLADHDDPGERHAVRVAASLDAAGIPDVRLIRFPDLPKGGDIAEWIQARPAHERRAAVEELVRMAPRWTSEMSVSEPTPGPDPAGRPAIKVRSELNAVTAEYQRALVAMGGTYQRGRQLVRVVRDPDHPVRGLTRPPGAPVIQPLSLAALRGLMDAAAESVCGVGKREQACLPPIWAAETLAAQGAWPFPVLDGVVESPVLRPDGTVLETPGYDGATGLLYEPSASFPPVPADPTRDDARAAIDELLTVLVDFPWVAPCDQAAAVAAMLGLVGRYAIPGCVPMTAVRATVPASGKGLLVDAICGVATGRSPARMTYPRDPEELRKRITAVAVEGLLTVLLDNVDRVLGSDVLAAALTAEAWQDRILGTQTTVTIPLRTVWFVTGNNITFKGDTGRRIVPVDLDPRCEHPEERAGFAHPDLLAWVRQHRPALVVAALTVLRAFHLAGRPQHGGPRLGSFEGWDDLVRSACIWVGLADPAAGRVRIREEDDADAAALREALSACETVYGSASFTVADVIGKTTGKDVRDPELRAALLALTGRDELAPHPLGLALRRVRGRMVGGRCFERAEDDSHRKVVRWQVAGNGGDCGNGFSPRTRRGEENLKGIRLEPFPQPPPFPAELGTDELADAERAIAAALEGYV